MTKVKVYTNNNGYIVKIEVKGHAFYANYGEDIVCSAISMICYTIGNKLLEIDEGNTIVSIKEGSFELSNTSFDEKSKLLMSTLFTGLKMVEEQYSDSINIKEVQK